MRRHEIPTHLDAPDRFLFGLTAKQAMQLMAAAAVTYGLVQNGALPLELRLPLAALVALLALVLSLVCPGGRAVEEWATLLVFHFAMPRRMVWAPCPVPVEEGAPRWTTLAPRVGWAGPQQEAGDALAS